MYSNIYFLLIGVLLFKSISAVPCECGAFLYNPDGDPIFLHSATLNLENCQPKLCQRTCVQEIRKHSNNENPYYMLDGLGRVGDLICSKAEGIKQLRIGYFVKVCFDSKWQQAGRMRRRICCTQSGEFVNCN